MSEPIHCLALLSLDSAQQNTLEASLPEAMEAYKAAQEALELLAPTPQRLGRLWGFQGSQGTA